MTNFKTLNDLPADLTGQRVLVRVDLNLPMAEGRATDLTRVRACAPTILELSERGAKVLLLAHYGRPGGERHSTMSLSEVVDGDRYTCALSHERPYGVLKPAGKHHKHTRTGAD